MSTKVHPPKDWVPPWVGKYEAWVQKSDGWEPWLQRSRKKEALKVSRAKGGPGGKAPHLGKEAPENVEVSLGSWGVKGQKEQQEIRARFRMLIRENQPLWKEQEEAVVGRGRGQAAVPTLQNAQGQKCSPGFSCVGTKWLWNKKIAILTCCPSIFTLWPSCSHPKSGHSNKDPKLRLLP